jgi:hypothetical protein
MGRLKGQAQGLRPGAFKLWVNWTQLGQLDCTSPPTFAFELARGPGGDGGKLRLDVAAQVDPFESKL